MGLFNVKGNAIDLSNNYCILKVKDVTFHSMEQNPLENLIVASCEGIL
jgi:hypothetical protein